jgi:hypothetical protein
MATGRSPAPERGLNYLFPTPSLPNKFKTSKAMCLQWLCVQACSTRRHSVRDFRAYINQSCSCEGLYYYFQLTPATAESLPTLTTYAEQTSAGKSDAIIL